MSDKYLSADDVSAAFAGIEFADGATFESAADVATLQCGKCRGRGTFIGYTGKVMGNCFACEGTGRVRSAGRVVQDGDCAKCYGTGQWAAGRSCFACNGTGKAAADKSAAIDVSAIETAFSKARENQIKRPKLRLADFIFSRAPDTGRNAG